MSASTEPPKIRSLYLNDIYHRENYPIVIEEVVLALRELGPFDTIAFRGHSGAAVAYPAALALRCDLSCVRRRDDKHWNEHDLPYQTEGSWLVEGRIDPKTYVILDDLVCSGDTAMAIVKEMGGLRSAPKCVAFVCWAARGENVWNPDPDRIPRRISLYTRIADRLPPPRGVAPF